MGDEHADSKDCFKINSNPLSFVIDPFGMSVGKVNAANVGDRSATWCKCIYEAPKRIGPDAINDIQGMSCGLADYVDPRYPGYDVADSFIQCENGATWDHSQL